MGKSPRTWIKSIILLKKFAYPKTSKSRDVIVSVHASITSQKHDEEQELGDENELLAADEKDPETARKEKAAIIIQQTTRNYMRRRSSKTLERIVTLQARMRGHLVRRRAADALRCVSALVKVQAVARGWSVRRSEIGNTVRGNCNFENLKIENSSSLEKHLKLLIANKLLKSRQCRPRVLDGSGKEWLNRWSDSRFWSPTKPKPMPNQEFEKSSTVQNDTKPDGFNNVLRHPLDSKGLKEKRNAVNKENKIPNYMAPTTSARAKLRIQDLREKKIASRRLSLPCPVAGKFSIMSTSPKKNEGRKSTGRVDKSFLYFRDGDAEKVKPQWKR